MDTRPATTDDLADIRRLTVAAGQADEDSGANPDYVRLLLDIGQVHVASTGDRVAGWAATRTAARGSMLTDLFVDPAQQARGVGRALLARVWPAGPGTAPRFTFSSQHAAALPLYVRAGLSPFWPLLYLSGVATTLAPVPATATRVSAATAADAERRHTGIDRSAEYAYWGRHRGSTGIVVHHQDRLVAAGAADASRVIHLCVTDEPAADIAVLAAVRALPSSVSLCLPGPHPALIRLLERGFVIGEHDTYLSTDRTALPTTWVYSPGLA